ncbi:Pyrrolo-quinoline quinone [Candidatus Sulfopaludibacter sp. SbA3]|nr:Pyrrolo-quinoline quinone [Candidatus Sulfopaludibacter sp. SbA3]
MPQANVIYLGVKGSVVALDRATGTEVWRTRLKGSGFVNCVLEQGQLYATTRGEIFRLDPTNGQIVWNNPLSGLGLGLVTVGTAVPSQAVPMEEKRRQEQQAAAAGGGA